MNMVDSWFISFDVHARNIWFIMLVENSGYVYRKPRLDSQ